MEKVRTLIVNRHYPQGLHNELWNATDDSGKKVPSGVYFYTFEFIGNKVLNRITKKLVVSR